MTNSKMIKITLVAIALLTACVSAVKYGGGTRDPAQVGRDIPTGLQGEDLHHYYHLSEGAEVYPYEWLLALRSVNFKWKAGNYSFDKDALVERPFLESLDWKFGMLKAPKENNPYLLDWAGMTVAWSNHPPDKADAKRSERDTLYRTLNNVLVFDADKKAMVLKDNVRSIKMVGTNCALCHTGEIEYGQGQYRIDGGPNMVNVRGFFQDMAQSTLGMLVFPELMAPFLAKFPDTVKNPDAKAQEITRQFLLEFGKATRDSSVLGETDEAYIKNARITLGFAKYLDMRRRLYKGSKAIGDALERLLRLTYGFGDADIGELKQRMEYFGRLMVGTNPANRETPSGFARTDAFGRIGNLVLRGDNPIDYTAPVSLPWMWGLKYQAMLHYTANTNSVILRNVGQSLGLGAQIFASKTGDKVTVHGSTVNIHNLDKLERLIHKIKVPQWREVFGTNTYPELTIREDMAARGKVIYDQKCKNCHEAPKKVGPANALYEYNVIPLNEIGTDKYAALNCAKPINEGLKNEGVFQEAILDGTKDIKARYYEQHKISHDKQKELEFEWLRGEEFFRDTLHGYTEQAKINKFYGDLRPAKNEEGYKPWGYQARHLAGVWATAPYLHNGSVPDMWELLKPAKDRVKIFNVRSRKFNPNTLGFEWRRQTEDKSFGRRVPVPCQKKNDDQCFDTSLAGNSNTGHESGRYDNQDLYGTRLNEQQKKDLIEYLKILPPEPEYGAPM